MSAYRSRLRKVRLTSKHIMAMFGRTTPYPFKGFAFMDCDKVVGIGGVMFCDGKWIAFSDIQPGATVPDITIWRCAKEVVRQIVAPLRVPVYAGVEPRAHKWALLLGFQPTEVKEVYIWVQA